MDIELEEHLSYKQKILKKKTVGKPLHSQKESRLWNQTFTRYKKTSMIKNWKPSV